MGLYMVFVVSFSNCFVSCGLTGKLIKLETKELSSKWEIRVNVNVKISMCYSYPLTCYSLWDK